MSDTHKNLYRKQMGSWGEREAEKYLCLQGLEILERNYHTRAGELDIIAKDGAEVVFIEVKTRKNLSFGYPEEAVTEKKKEHMITAAENYLEIHPEYLIWRMDVLAINGFPGSKSIQYEWFKNVD